MANRLMVEAIYQICKERDIAFTSLSDDWLLELTKDGVTKRVLGYKFSINDAVASSIAGDKVAAHLLLKRADVLSVEHVLLRLKVSDEQKKPLKDWPKFVVKPLDGSGGHGVRLFENVEEAAQWIESTGYPAWAAAPWMDIVREIRVVLLDQKPLIVYEKQAVLKDGLKMFNLGLGATPKDIAGDDDLLQMAAKAQGALGLRLSAVDVIETTEGKRHVLEVNSGFMMEHYMGFSPEYKQRGIEAYRRIVDAVMNS